MTEKKTEHLPLMGNFDEKKVAAEAAALRELDSQPFFKQAKGYIKRTGPGLMQSAMTLGAGSAAGSVCAGAYFGYQFLWVQPVAIFLGVMMLGALGNVFLTTGDRAYQGVSNELGRVGPAIAFLWAAGTIFASVIWHVPQYGLASGAFNDIVTLVGEMAGKQSLCEQAVEGGGTTRTAIGYLASVGIGLAILTVNIIVTWNYGSGSKGIRVYEWFLRIIIASVILAFGFVVCTTGINFERLAAGNWGFSLPTSAKEITTVIGLLGAAVGINMTFLYPYSLQAKGWGKSHKKLQRWDLGMTMFIPFVLVTSLIMIAMANTVNIAPGETFKPVDASKALSGSLGVWGRLIFDLGFIGMTCGAISTHMVVCGFTACEMFGFKYTTWRYRLCTLIPAIGIIGVIVPVGDLLFLPVIASAICVIFLPLAYIIFFVLNNKRSYIGKAVGKGSWRVVYNVILVIAIIVATVAGVIGFNNNVRPKLVEYYGYAVEYFSK